MTEPERGVRMRLTYFSCVKPPAAAGGTTKAAEYEYRARGRPFAQLWCLHLR